MNALRNWLGNQLQTERNGAYSDQMQKHTESPEIPRSNGLGQQQVQGEEKEPSYLRNGGDIPAIKSPSNGFLNHDSLSENRVHWESPANSTHLKRKPLSVLPENVNGLHHQRQHTTEKASSPEVQRRDDSEDPSDSYGDGPRARTLEEGFERVADEVLKGTIALTEKLKKQRLPSTVNRSELENITDQVTWNIRKFVWDEFYDIMKHAEGGTCLDKLDEAHLDLLKRGQVAEPELARAEETSAWHGQGQGQVTPAANTAVDEELVDLRSRETAAPEGTELQQVPVANERIDEVVSREHQQLDESLEKVQTLWKEVEEQNGQQDHEMEALQEASACLLAEMEEKCLAYQQQ